MSVEASYINYMVDKLNVLCWREGTVFRAGCPKWHEEGPTRNDAVDRFKSKLHQKLSEMPFSMVDIYLDELVRQMKQ